MSFAYARAQRDAYLLSRMEAEAFSQRPGHNEPVADVQAIEDQVIEDQAGFVPEHRHGDGCACHLRGE
jgi:hypothetical protein